MSELAKELEAQHKWVEAAKVWGEDTENSKACLFIAESCEKGDKFRAIVKELKEDGRFTEDQIYRIANTRVYGRPY